MWRADLVRTRTGQIGARLDVEPAGQITDETNGIPQGAVGVRRALIDRIPAAWWEPWRNAVVLRHRYSTADPWIPILGGPIIHYPAIDPDVAALSFAGIQEILRHRLLVHEWTDYSRIEDWKSGGPWWEGSLGQIAWNVVQMAQAKPRGSLPIVHGTPDELITDATRAGRGWHNWDTANLNVWEQVLKGLADDDGGPDLRFTPRDVSDVNRRIEWVFEHGTHHDPRIAHPYTIRLDATAARSPVSDLKVTVSGLSIAHRVYGSGAGEGAGTEVRIAERIETAIDEMPFLETAFADTSRTAWQDVLALAEGALSPGGTGSWQAVCKVHTSPGLPLWQVRPGAPVQLKVRGLEPFPNGWHRGRILKTSYSLASDIVDVEIEQEV